MCFAHNGMLACFTHDVNQFSDCYCPQKTNRTKQNYCVLRRRTSLTPANFCLLDEKTVSMFRVLNEAGIAVMRPGIFCVSELSYGLNREQQKPFSGTSLNTKAS